MSEKYSSNYLAIRRMKAEVELRDPRDLAIYEDGKPKCMILKQDGKTGRYFIPE
jgi:hypothetical protein